MWDIQTCLLSSYWPLYMLGDRFCARRPRAISPPLCLSSSFERKLSSLTCTWSKRHPHRQGQAEKNNQFVMTKVNIWPICLISKLLLTHTRISFGTWIPLPMCSRAFSLASTLWTLLSAPRQNLFPPEGSTYPSTITEGQPLGTLNISPTCERLPFGYFLS